MSVGNQQRSYVKFDISSITPGATVISATLTVCRTNGSGGSRTHELRTVTSTWTEPGLTWSNQPTLAVSAQASVTAPSSAGCTTADVKNDVQSWLLGTPNFGWRIADTNESTAPTVDWATRENGTASDRPILTVVHNP
jgi:hypothetical protein